MEKVETGCSDMELIMDMLSDDNTSIHNDSIEDGYPPSYYEGKALNILQQLKDKDNYFHFLKTILKNYNLLEDSHKKQIIKILNVQPEIIIKEKVIFQKKSKNTKAKLNMNDDY